jgi:hypothetical protein
VTEKLDAEAKRLRKLSPGAIADRIGTLEAQVDALKGEAIRRELHRAEGQAFKITMTPPGMSQRTDKTLLLKVLGITAGEYAARFTYPVHSGWRMTCTALRKVAAAA